MAISLKELRKHGNNLAPLNLIYAVQGMGKTSLALQCPDTVYIQILPERPPHGLEPVSFGEMTEFRQVLEAMTALYVEEHPYRHVAFDSLDALEPLVWREACARNNWTDIETPGYGKGYLAADHVWREFIAGCDALRRDKNIAVSWLALAEATNHEEPGKQPYKRYDMRIHKRGEGLLTQAADAVLFINTKVEVKDTDAGFGLKKAHAEGGGARWLFTDGRPAFVAKNRFNMPDQIMLPKGKSWEAVAPYLPQQVAPVVVDASAQHAA